MTDDQILDLIDNFKDSREYKMQLGDRQRFRLWTIIDVNLNDEFKNELNSSFRETVFPPLLNSVIYCTKKGLKDD